MTDPVNNLEDIRAMVRRLLMERALLQENPEKQKALDDEIETLLLFVLDTWSEDARAITWVVLSAKKDSELENRAIHALYILNRETPFPGF